MTDLSILMTKNPLPHSFSFIFPLSEPKQLPAHSTLRPSPASAIPSLTRPFPTKPLNPLTPSTLSTKTHTQQLYIPSYPLLPSINKKQNPRRWASGMLSPSQHFLTAKKAGITGVSTPSYSRITTKEFELEC